MHATYCGILKITGNRPAVWIQYAAGEKPGIVGEYVPGVVARGIVTFEALGVTWTVGQLNQPGSLRRL